MQEVSQGTLEKPSGDYARGERLHNFQSASALGGKIPN